MEQERDIGLRRLCCHKGQADHSSQASIVCRSALAYKIAQQGLLFDFAELQ
jgi:hypothetical protein